MRTTARRRSSVIAALATATAALVVGALVAPSAQAAPAGPSAPAAAARMVPTAVAPPPEGWPEFGYQGVITDKSQMDYNPTNEYIFPSVFHAGAHFENPLGEWYLYTAPHDSPAGVLLMYADSLEGPWIEYGSNPIIASEWLPHYDVSHTSSPDAIWNEEAGKMFMYFHGENSVPGTPRRMTASISSTATSWSRTPWGDRTSPRRATPGSSSTRTPPRASRTACSTWATSVTTSGASASPSPSTGSPGPWTPTTSWRPVPKRARTSRRAICGSGTAAVRGLPRVERQELRAHDRQDAP